MTAERKIAEVAGLIRKSERILFVTGAGISVDSGLPTYRGVGGLYDGQVTEEGIAIEEILSHEMFERRPELTWKYLWEVGEACRGAKPNRAHEVIAELERRKERVVVMTQNVDGLHRSAGSTDLIEVHGRADRVFCTGCDFRCEAEQLVAAAATDKLSLPPLCPECEAVLHPDVVLFGEMLPEEAMARIRQLPEIGFELVVSVGTSSQFFYITEPIRLAKEFGIPTVEINPAETDISAIVDFHLQGGAAETLEQLWVCQDAAN